MGYQVVQSRIRERYRPMPNAAERRHMDFVAREPCLVCGVYQKAKNKAGIDVHIHDLRGTYVTWLCVKGLTDQEVSKIVGWSETTVAEIRLHYVDQARVVVSIVERLSA